MRLVESPGASLPPWSRLSERLGGWRSDANHQWRRPRVLKQRLPRTRSRTERICVSASTLAACADPDINAWTFQERVTGSHDPCRFTRPLSSHGCYVVQG